MATLTTAEKDAVMKALARYARANDLPVTWVKDAVRDAAQAIEDELTAAQATISAAVDTATSPHGITFTGAQKKIIGAWVFNAKYGRDK